MDDQLKLPAITIMSSLVCVPGLYRDLALYRGKSDASMSMEEVSDVWLKLFLMC